MKTDIIHLETFDDIDSIRDRLEWSKADRLVLVWPKRGGIRLNSFEMALLARKAASLGRQIAFVTEEAETTEMAAAQGIPVFYSQASATLARWPINSGPAVEPVIPKDLEGMRVEVEKQREKTLEKPPARNLVFISGVFAVFAMLLFFLPSATVHINPMEITQTLDIMIQAQSEIVDADMAGFIPLLSITSLQTAADRVETTGQMPISDQFARGSVSLKNLTGNGIRIPEGSIVATLSEPPVRFIIESGLEIPGGESDLSVEIRAVEPGFSGNIAGDEITSLEGPLGLDVAVVNPEPTSGGGESLLRAPSEDDIITLREKVKSMLMAQAVDGFNQSRRDGQVYLEDSLKIEKIIDEEISAPAGQPADMLEISLTGEVEMKYILMEEIEQSARLAMNAVMPGDYEPVDETIAVTPINEPKYDRNSSTLTWEVHAERKLKADFQANYVIHSVAGKNSAEAVELLAGMLDHRDVPMIAMRPSWWPRLPFLPFRIEVEAH